MIIRAGSSRCSDQCNGSCDENCCKSSVNDCRCAEDCYECESEDLESAQVAGTKNYPQTSKDELPSDIKVQELFNIFDHALYRAFKEYRPTYGEMFLAVFQLQQKLYTLYMRDIARSNMELMRMEIAGMVNAERRGCSRLDIYT